MTRSVKITFATATLMATIALFVIGWVLPNMARSSNCGGNSAALSVCKSILLNLQLAAENDQLQKGNVYSLSESNKAELKRIASYCWVEGSKFYLRTNVLLNSQPRQLIVVCDTAYGNIPQPTIWNGFRKTPAHAVVFSDGATSLISPEEFKKLDLRGFVDTTQLATNSPASTNQSASL